MYTLINVAMVDHVSPWIHGKSPSIRFCAQFNTFEQLISHVEDSGGSWDISEVIKIHFADQNNWHLLIPMLTGHLIIIKQVQILDANQIQEQSNEISLRFHHDLCTLVFSY
jgi:hypothetical protein